MTPEQLDDLPEEVYWQWRQFLEVEKDSGRLRDMQRGFYG
jgi:hypothetical protein